MLNDSQLGKGILVQSFTWGLGYLHNLFLPLDEGQFCGKCVFDGCTPGAPSGVYVTEREMPVSRRTFELASSDQVCGGIVPQRKLLHSMHVVKPHVDAVAVQTVKLRNGR